MFPVWGIVNKAAVNIRVEVFVLKYVFISLEEGLVGHMVCV